MKQEIIGQGAEARLTLKENQVSKLRIKKSYRITEIDNKLRNRRTKSEAKIISKLAKIIPVPKIISTNLNKKEIIMQYILGKKLSTNLEKLNWKKLCKQLGETLSLLHNQDIIHGDLTTSNMIYKSDADKIYLIDFGLGFHSRKIEDKAVDLHLLRQALEAKHYTIWDQAFKIILKNYHAKDHELIIKRISTIEKRGRYKGH
ncbi:Kae1-associated serine/threonine protein kinase [Candidatus Pacearchaeota archaeon]|nr:Kae1-associated serine/threonine protein kinase [Candidatus Pacearchaeota archaeon]